MSKNDVKDDSKLSATTRGVDAGFDNRAFSNDDNEGEPRVKNDVREHSIFLQEKQMYAYVCKTDPSDCDPGESPIVANESIEKDGSLEESGNRRCYTEATGDPSSIHPERSTKDGEGKEEGKEKKDEREEEEGDDSDAVAASKEIDIATMENCVDSREEDLEESTDMFYALSRSSIDLREKGLKTYKISKIRKMFILFSCFFMQVCLGLLFSLGILYVELLDAFGSNRSLTSLVQSLPLGLAYMLGLIVGPLIQKLGLRVSIFCGGLLTATGFIASSFVNDIYSIIVLVGGVSGTGISMFNIGSFASLPVYFGKKQKVAVAFTAFGTGAGAMLWPLMNRVLLKHFGWRGNMLITGGILLNVCSLSLFFKPLPTPKDQKESELKTKKALSLRQKFVQLMKIPTFLALIFWCIIDGFSTPVIGQMIVDFSRVNGYGRDEGAMLLVYYSASNAIGRATIGIISRFKLRSYLFFILTSFLCGGSYLAVSFTSVYQMTIVAVIAAGLMLGSHVALTMIVLLKTVGSDLYGLAWGLAATCLGIGFTISGPIAGYISDLRSYNASFFVAGSAIIADMVVYSTIIMISRFLKRKAMTP